MVVHDDERVLLAALGQHLGVGAEDDPAGRPPVGQEDDLGVDGPHQVVVDPAEEAPVGRAQGDEEDQLDQVDDEAGGEEGGEGHGHEQVNGQPPTPGHGRGR